MTRRRFEFPDGALYEVLVPADSTGGARSDVRVTLPPKSSAGPPHAHPRQQETCVVGDGALEVQSGREWRTVLAGEELTFAPGTVHAIRNRLDQNVTFRLVHTPALGFQQYLERLYWLQAMNRITGRLNLSSALYRALLLDLHRRDHLPAGPAARLGVRTLAPVARLLGFRVDPPHSRRPAP